MKNITHIIPSLPGASSSPLCSRAKAFLLLAAILPLLLSTASIGFAGSATWKASPGSGDWNTANNWMPMTVPNGTADTATFASSNTTGVSLSAVTEVNGIVFNAGASAFTITASPPFTLTISGVGITNNSGITQNFVAGAGGTSGFIVFTNGATAGSLTMFTNNAGRDHTNGGVTKFFGTSTAGNGTFTNNGSTGGDARGGHTFFHDTSTAGNGTFTNNAAAVGGARQGFTKFFDHSTAGSGTFTNNGGAVSRISGGRTQFSGSSTAGNGTFTNNGSTVSGAVGGFTVFNDTSTAGSGTFNNNGSAFSSELSGGVTEFFSFSSTADNSPTAGNSTLIANGGSGAGGTIVFYVNSTGGTARVEVFGNGKLNINPHDYPGVTIGSIEGDGNVFLGGNKLTVGSNNLSTVFSGTIQDGSPFGGGGTGGSLTKIGKGKLTLSKASTYTGGTTVSKGALLVKNETGSATGTGAVQVNAGTLGGTGTIAGAVTVGTRSGSKALLSPGNGNKPRTFTIQSTLTFNSGATYKVQLHSATANADKVVANGVTINNAQFSFANLGNATLSTGTVFTMISNTAATPIAGTFSNLADGATFTNNGNSYKVNYQGGDGNDLTLKVVP